jgi:hypothetical protein
MRWSTAWLHTRHSVHSSARTKPIQTLATQTTGSGVGGCWVVAVGRAGAALINLKMAPCMTATGQTNDSPAMLADHSIQDYYPEW